MQDFKVVREDIEDIKLALTEIQTTLDETYEKAVELLEAVENSGNWLGEAHLVGAAFLRLTTQYHGMLSAAENRPVEQAYEGLNTFLETDSEFYDNWELYQELLQI